MYVTLRQSFNQSSQVMINICFMLVLQY